VITPAG